MVDLVKPFSEIFSNRVFYVPDYQRGYSWGKKQWNDLIQDLELLPDGRRHFTGTLILREENKSSVTDEEGRLYRPYDVIDGQQRLTTCVLFLKAIHAEMQELPGFTALANGLREMYLSNLDLNRQPFTKLTLNRDSRDFFSNNILGFSPDVKGASIRSHQTLAQGMIHFSEYLKHQREVLGENYSEWLKQLYFKLTQNLTLIVYEVDNELDAGIIFETMNDRGIDLTELEKVKNYLLYVSSKLNLKTDHDLSERINLTWTHIFEELMLAGLSDTRSEDQLLRAHWLAIYDYNPQNWANCRSIKDRFSLRKYLGKHQDLLQEIIDYLDTLKNAATAYCDLHRPNRIGAFNDIQNSVRRTQIIQTSWNLARLGARASFHPLLIAVRLKADDGGETYLKAAELCERYDFRVYQWMHRQSRTGQSQLFRMGYDFYKTSNSQELIRRLTQAIFLYCSEDQFNHRFNDDTVDWYRWDGLKYFLYEYEQYKADKAGKPVIMPWEFLQRSKKEDTIEHILPQTPKKEYWQKRFSSKQRKRWTHDIGNLTLTYDNSPLGNKPFRNGKSKQDKVNYYSNSKLFIEQELKDVRDWTEAEIIHRREAIKEWAIQRWHVEHVEGFDEPEPSSKQDALFAKAFRFGVGLELQVLFDLIHRYGFHTRPYLHCVMCAPPKNHTLALFTVWIQPGILRFGLFHETISANFPIQIKEVIDLLGNKWQDIDPDAFPEFLNHLEELFIRITSK